MSQEGLMVLNNADTAMMEVGGLGLGAAAQLLAKPTKVELVQGLSKVADIIRPGRFYNGAMKLELADANDNPEVQFIPIRFHQVRERFINGKWEEGAKPVCRSYDGAFPVPGTEDNHLTPFAAQCMNLSDEKLMCDEAKFNKKYKALSRGGKKAENDLLTNGGKPMCNSRWVITYIEASTKMLMYQIFSRTSSFNVKELRDGITMNAVANNQKLKLKTQRKQDWAEGERMLNAFDYLVTMRAKKSDDGKNHVVYFPTVNPIKSVEEVQEYFAIYQAFWDRRAEFEAELAADSEEEALQQEAAAPTGAGL